ncbi:hypothetical protein [Ochrobactrum sp. SFR4]|nr:hypothetical protein [Ochrobactrum sp. SFR4]MBX8827455.1 hypothetical protein [Ochrobactrum sp. SFR4]
MKLPSAFPHLKGVRFPREIIAYSIWTGCVAKFSPLLSYVTLIVRNGLR